MRRRHTRGNARAGVAPAVTILCLLAVRPVAATPAPLGSEALYHWLTGTAAQALKAAAASDNDLRPGGLLALNQSAQGSLDQIEALAPDWLDQVDLRLAFNEDLFALYGVKARHALYEDEVRRLRIDAIGRIDHDQTGRTSGEVGVAVARPVQEQTLSLALYGAIDQEWLRRVERYTLRSGFDWGPFKWQGQIYNETTMDEPSGALYEERLLDGYEVGIEAGLPPFPWLAVVAKHVWRAPAAPHADDFRSNRYSLRLRPIAGLEIETGSEGTNYTERNWFTRLSYKIQLD